MGYFEDPYVQTNTDASTYTVHIKYQCNEDTSSPDLPVESPIVCESPHINAAFGCQIVSLFVEA